MSIARALLDCLGRDSLVRLVYARALPTSRENHERRSTLARSYRGDVEALILDLSHTDLVDVFRQLNFEINGTPHCLSNPSKYRLDELRAFAIRAFVGRRVRIVGEFEPVVEESEADDVDEDIADDDGDAPEDAAEDEGERRPFRSLSDEWSRPRKIARVLRRLDMRAPERLRNERFRQLLIELRARGIEACLASDRSCTVLEDDAESPGIAAKLRLRLVGDDRRVHRDDGAAVDLSEVEALLVDEKVATLGLRRDPKLLYFIKDGAVWASRRRSTAEEAPPARRIADIGAAMDHQRYVYYLDSDGDLARKERGGHAHVDGSVGVAGSQLEQLGWAIIHSDGVVDPREVAELQRLRDGTATERLTGVAEIDRALLAVRSAPEHVRRRLVEQLFSIAAADDRLAEEEIRLLEQIEQQLVPGSADVASMAERWRRARADPAPELDPGDKLIDDILSILRDTTQWEPS